MVNREKANLLFVFEFRGTSLCPLENILREVSFSVQCHISVQAGELICSVKRPRTQLRGPIIKRILQTKDGQWQRYERRVVVGGVAVGRGRAIWSEDI